MGCSLACSADAARSSSRLPHDACGRPRGTESGTDDDDDDDDDDNNDDEEEEEEEEEEEGEGEEEEEEDEEDVAEGCRPRNLTSSGSFAPRPLQPGASGVASVNVRRPEVSVPVLSKTTAFTLVAAWVVNHGKRIGGRGGGGAQEEEEHKHTSAERACDWTPNQHSRHEKRELQP